MADGIRRIIRCMSYLRRVRPLAWILAAVAAALLALSFILEPTPTTYIVIERQRVPVTHDNAVDYAISFSRLVGVVLLIAGSYLGYRSAHPDEIVVDDGLPPSGYDKHVNINPVHGNPASRSGVG
jgi:hypothetical protein